LEHIAQQNIIKTERKTIFNPNSFRRGEKKLNQTLNVCAKDNSNKMDENILEREKSFQSELS